MDQQTPAMRGPSFEPRPSARRIGGLRLADAITLVSVGLVVLLVSLPRLRDFALRENEADARIVVARIGELVLEHDSPAALREVLAASPDWLRRLGDAEWLEGGRMLRRHGYLFDLVRIRPDGAVAVRAWPLEHGGTGHAAFVWTADTGLLGHGNEGGAWSGPGDPPRVEPAAGWRIQR